LQIGLINPATGTEYTFAGGYHHVTHHGWWGQLVIPFQFLQPWTAGTSLNPAQVSALFVSVLKQDANDVGGVGRIAIDNLMVQNVANRPLPPNLETIAPSPTASNTAVAWLINQQQDTGLLKSWEEEVPCLAHTYDQALALIVFATEHRWTGADALVEALGAIQEADGSWLQTHDCLTRESLPSEKWEGDIAWAVYALNRYLALGGTHPQGAAFRDRAADWLIAQLNPADGCLLKDQTEATIDAWWALATAGPDYAVQAEGLKNCLLTFYWDDAMGRFKGGRAWWQPYLDNQTWGAAFLHAIGREEDARRTLSYAWETLRLPAQGGQTFGFDGQAGPWSVWNEGNGQYVALGGAGACDLLSELLAQQRADGAMPGSPDDFRGAGVWTTRWHGVAPTAWLYNALHHEPFTLNHNIYLPTVISGDPSNSEVSCRWYCPYGHVCLTTCM
jgi:hypothetical protein